MSLQLLESDIVEEVDGGVRLSDGFRETVEKKQQLWEESEQSQRPEDRLEIDTEEALAGLDEEDEVFLVEYAALADTLLESATEDLIRWTAILDQFKADATPTSGSPEPFLSIAGEKLPSILKLFSPAIVYVWREECDPCDIVREDFESIFTDAPGDIALFSVYGPDNSVMLQERYDVRGGPTALFIADGRVDSRLVGPHSRSALESEIEILRDVA